MPPFARNLSQRYLSERGVTVPLRGFQIFDEIVIAFETGLDQ